MGRLEVVHNIRSSVYNWVRRRVECVITCDCGLQGSGWGDTPVAAGWQAVISYNSHTGHYIRMVEI